MADMPHVVAGDFRRHRLSRVFVVSARCRTTCGRRSVFSEFAELTISLKPFGRRADEIGNPLRHLPDCIELRGKGDAYELVLIKSENRRGWIDPEGPAVALIKLPYEFLRSLQTQPKRHESLMAYFDKQRGMLERVGLKYWADDEMSDVWDYKGKYADLHWWTF